jgi:hypothetical protein
VVRLRGGAFVTVAENTTLRIERAAAGEGFLLRLAAGLISVFSRRPEALEVGTPFANAAVEGTEFVVAVEADRARVTVLEGRVGFGNPRGRLSLAAGSTAVARAGEAPVIELDVRPRDAVRWALYYPPVSPDLPGGGRDEATLARRCATRSALRREGRPGAAAARLEATPEAGRDAAWHVLRAELALAAGRPDEAAAAVDRALALDPGSGEALALRAVAAVARGGERGGAGRRAARRGGSARCRRPAPRLVLRPAGRLRPRRRARDAGRGGARRPGRRPGPRPAGRGRTRPRRPARGQARRAEARRLAPDLARTGLAEGFAALAGLDTRAARRRSPSSSRPSR